MNDIDNILGNIGTNPFEGLGVSVMSLLKAPIILILVGNLLFSVLLFLRARILADTFESSSNSIVKTMVGGYIILTVIGSIVTVLFLLIG